VFVSDRPQWVYNYPVCLDVTSLAQYRQLVYHVVIAMTLLGSDMLKDAVFTMKKTDCIHFQMI
jgi:hypothetical protein